jgi:hypothetical protein
MTEQPASANLLANVHEPAKFKQLATAQITWVQDEDNNNWVVRTNDGEELFQLPGRLTDKEAMAILRAAREYELKAFEDGKDTGMGAMKAVMRNQIVELDVRNMALRTENERLAGLLQMHIEG